MSRARYNALAEFGSGLGRYELALELNGTETGQRQTVHVVCPPPLLPMPGNLSCGCEAGLEPTESGECVPCSAGYHKTHRSMDLCDPCEVGMFQPITGQTACLRCARGSFQGSRGMEECAPCGPGTSSEAGAWRCTDCLPGSYAAGGEPKCLPCAPGEANDKEAQAQCTFCLAGLYAGTGFTTCRKCGMFDHSQLTNGVPHGVECTGSVLNGTKPGFWAAYPMTEDSANWTRVWKRPQLEQSGACSSR